jgi:hypothetical protein
MLRIQLGAFEQVIRKLQEELAKRDQAQAQLTNTVEQLRDEVKQLRTQSESQAAENDRR